MKNEGVKINHKKVMRLMKDIGIKSTVRPKRYNAYKGEVGRIAPNLIERNFKTVRPNEKWVTDVTEFKIYGEKRYLSTFMDLYNREIVGSEVTSRPVYGLVGDMLCKALKKVRRRDNLMIHSDQGWQYQMKDYQKRLKSKNIVQSMSRKGNCYDNAAMENFFGHVKSELFYNQKFDSAEHFERELKDYIYYYNHKRIQANLNGLSPIDYRTQAERYNQVTKH